MGGHKRIKESEGRVSVIIQLGLGFRLARQVVEICADVLSPSRVGGTKS